MVLELKHIHKGFTQGHNSIQVLKNLSLSVAAGEKVAILGPSGSGKSTLLTLIAGLDSPDQGEILFQKRNITALNEQARTFFRAQNVGIIFQQHHLLNYLTAFENVALPLELLNQDDIETRTLSALQAVGLMSRKDHYPHMLSGGENQRVAIARALVTRPKLLVADEPSGSLDEKTGQTVMQYLFDIVCESQITLLLITHNKDLAAQCDRALHLREGQLT